MDPKLLGVLKELIAVAEAKDEHMRKWPEWWAAADPCRSEEECMREPNAEWSAICGREYAARHALMDAAREVVAAENKEAA